MIRKSDIALLLQEIAQEVFSYHGVGRKAPERFLSRAVLGNVSEPESQPQVTSKTRKPAC